MEHPPLVLPIAPRHSVPDHPPVPFGEVFTDHMFTATWSTEEGWRVEGVGPRRPLLVDPALVGIHYGQSIFEGLKAHRQVNGSLALFRPMEHAHRMSRSARRLAMPEPPPPLFLRAVTDLVRADQDWLGDDPALSLYLRPVMFATEPCLALRPSRRYLFLVIAFVAAGFFADRPEPVSVWVSDAYSRAEPGGTGSAKCGGNYAGGFLAQVSALEHGCRQVVWLDPVDRTRVEEMGGMNIFVVRESGGRIALTTPRLTDTLLPGVTRDALLTLAGTLGLAADERDITVDEWRTGCRSGAITESFACGTAAVVTPIGAVHTATDSWEIGGGQAGPVTLRLSSALRELQRGAAADPHGWMQAVG